MKAEDEEMNEANDGSSRGRKCSVPRLRLYAETLQADLSLSWSQPSQIARVRVRPCSTPGCLDVIGLLLGHYSDVNSRNANKSTPLFMASQEGELQVARNYHSMAQLQKHATRMARCY